METPIKQIQWFDDRFYALTDDTGKTEYLESVTTVLNATPKPQLARWRGEVGNEIADQKMHEAGDRGTRIHHGCLAYVSGGVVVHNPWDKPNFSDLEMAELRKRFEGKMLIVIQKQEEMYQIDKFSRWMQLVKPKMVAAEMMVYSLTEHSAGSLDYIMEIQKGKYLVAGSEPLVIEKSGLYVVDLKSSNQLSDDYFMQISAYRKFYEEMQIADMSDENHEDIQGGLIIHTNADTRKGIVGLTTKFRSLEELDQDFVDFQHVHAVWRRSLGSAKPKVFSFPSIITMDTEAA